KWLTQTLRYCISTYTTLFRSEIARRTRHTGDTPIIILTAADDVDTKVEMLNAGADDYLAKPFHIEELIARAGVQLRKRDSHSTRDRKSTRLNSSHDSITYAVF